MKQIKKLKLTKLAQKELGTKQMKALKGGDYCTDKCGTSTSVIGSVYGSWVNEFYG